MERYLATLNPILDIPFIRRIRRNHGLEHGTIHMMSRSIDGLRIVGRSDSKGFWLWGDVTTEQVEKNVNKALSLMQNGQHDLAVHPNCGTNLVTTASIGAVAVLIALMGSDKERGGKLQRFPLIVMAIMGAVILGQPLGMDLQKYVTTLGDPADLQIKSIKRIDRRGVVTHRVETWSS